MALYDHKADAHDPHKDVDYAQALKDLDDYEGGLCEVCAGIDFDRLFDYLKGQRRYVLDLRLVQEQTATCIFCRVVFTAVRNRPDVLRNGATELVVRTIATTGLAGGAAAETVPHMLLCIYVKICDLQEPVLYHSGDEAEANMLTDFGYDPNDPLLALEHVGSPAEPPPATDVEMEADTESSSGSDSDYSEFERTWIAKLSAEWRMRMTREPIPSQVQYDRIRARLHATDDIYRDQSSRRSTSSAGSLGELIACGRLRMIDVTTGNVVILRRAERFLTLSYVWGGHVFHSAAVVRSSPQDSGDLAWDVNWQHVPITICDAVEFVRLLGERFLWVDSLCIDQADDSDKRAVIPEMLSIYGASYLTLVAAAGRDAQHGIPGVRPHSRNAERCIIITRAPGHVVLLPARQDGPNVIKRSIWDTRAWTYQEHLLSTRSLFFTQSEANLSTETGSIISEKHRIEPLDRDGSVVEVAASAGVQDPRTALLLALHHGETLSWRHYAQSVVDYTSRRLTSPGDRLAAFLGMYSRFCAPDNTSVAQEACSGLPPQWFYQCLMWKADYRSLQESEHARVRFDATQSRFLPSWSWVGWTGRIDLREEVSRERYEGLSVQVIDDRNIVCDCFTNGVLNIPPSQPSPVIGEGGGVTLHLWATILELGIVRSRFMPWTRCDVVSGPSGDLISNRIGSIKLDEQSAAKFCNNKPHTFLVLDTKIMLIEDHGEVYERVALGGLSRSEAAIVACIATKGRQKYVRLK